MIPTVTLPQRGVFGQFLILSFNSKGLAEI